MFNNIITSIDFISYNSISLSNSKIKKNLLVNNTFFYLRNSRIIIEFKIQIQNFNNSKTDLSDLDSHTSTFFKKKLFLDPLSSYKKDGSHLKKNFYRHKTLLKWHGKSKYV